MIGAAKHLDGLARQVNPDLGISEPHPKGKQYYDHTDKRDVFARVQMTLAALRKVGERDGFIIPHWYEEALKRKMAVEGFAMPEARSSHTKSDGTYVGVGQVGTTMFLDKMDAIQKLAQQVTEQMPEHIFQPAFLAAGGYANSRTLWANRASVPVGIPAIFANMGGHLKPGDPKNTLIQINGVKLSDDMKASLPAVFNILPELVRQALDDMGPTGNLKAVDLNGKEYKKFHNDMRANPSVFLDGNKKLKSFAQILTDIRDGSNKKWGAVEDKIDPIGGQIRAAATGQGARP